MSDLVVLYTGDIVYLSSVSDNDTFDPLNQDLLFFKSGRVRRFKKNGIAYMAIFDEITEEFVSYRSEISFWNYNKANIVENTSSTSYTALGSRFNILDVIAINVDDNSRVVVAHKKIFPNSLQNNAEIKYEIEYKFYPYKVAFPIRKFVDLLNPDGYEFISFVPQSVFGALTPYYHFIINKKYLGANGQLRDVDSGGDDIGEIGVLADVILVLDFVYISSGLINQLNILKLSEPFHKHINLPNRYNNNYGSIEIEYHSLYDDEYFARFRLGLIEFRYWIIQYKDDYTKIDENALAVYIVNLFSYQELNALSYDTKINLLNKILRDNFWIIGNWGFNKLNEEEAIIKIIRSIASEDLNGNLNYSDIDKFMMFLNSIYDFAEEITLYQVLYDRINDTAFSSDDGKGNKGQLVKTVYNLWLESKFNPQHSVTTIAQNALSYFKYTPFNALWQTEDPTITFPIPDETAAPKIICYESEKILLWYVDNFKFEFYNNKILAKQDIKDYGYQPYGFYDIFQPIALRVTDSDDTIIRMPVKGIATSANYEDFINNCIPIFYLQYVDDLGDYSDTKETIGTAIDVVLTFTGVGNIAKLRHIKDVSLLRKLFIAGELTLVERVALTRALSGLASASEAVIAIASLVFRFSTASCTVYYNNAQNTPEPTDPEYQKYTLCQSINGWLFALEMLSLSGDLLARRAFNRATKRLQQSIPAGSQYNELRTAVNSLDELDSLLIDFLQSIQTTYPNVFARVNNFSTQEKKFAFMFDFEESPNKLDILNANDGELVEQWSKVEYFKPKRKELDFLIDLKKLKNSDELEIEVFKGRSGKKLKLEFENLPPPHPDNRYTWDAKGVHHKEALQSFGSGGKGRIVAGTEVDVGPQGLGYYKAKVEVYNPEFPNNGGWKVKDSKGGKSTFFPDSWTKQKLQEELAFAFESKIYQKNNIWHGKMSDGIKVQFHIDNGIIKTAFPIF
jgi:hypothetical protein